MPLASGIKLGPYEIVAPLAAGGMGEVYRARDARLGREVALKVLPVEFAADASRRQRFEQEARAASALNHPNILTIYDVGNEGGVSFIVSELVDGDSLRALVRKGEVPIRKLLDVGVQLADGLAAAHRAAIVHRDLKPENVMLTREGRVKILDFGLAKHTPAMPSAGDDTVTVANTQAGVILGTVNYMSPEQARGEIVDFRSDQFSFGLILYELLTGNKAFHRNTVPETLTAILREEPQFAEAAIGTAPPPLRWVIERCLAKDPADRYAATTDLFRDLRTLRDHLSEAWTQETSKAAAPANMRQRRRVKTAAALAGAAIVGFAIGWLALPAGNRGVAQHRFVPLATEEGFESGAAWSPDGKSIAYSGEIGGVNQIFTRSLSAATAVQITTAKAACTRPFWSPDATRIFYISSNALWSIGAAGGQPTQVLPDVANAAISPDGKTLAIARNEASDTTIVRQSLWLSSPPGGTPRKYEQAPLAGKQYYQSWLRFSPDGSKLGLYVTLWDGKPAFWIIPVPVGKPRQVLASMDNFFGSFGWMPDGRHIVISQRRAGTAGAHLWMGDIESGRLDPVTSGSGEENEPTVSPDGTRVAFTVRENQADLVDIPLDGKPMRPLLSSSRSEAAAEWSPSGQEFAYVTDRNGPPEIWLGEARTGRQRPVVTQKDFGTDPSRTFTGISFSPDGQRLAYSRFGTTLGRNGAIWISAVSGGPPIRALEEAEDNPQQLPAWSPDGNSIVFANSRSGTVVLAKAAVGGSVRPVILKERVVTAPPKWSPKGDWILYLMPDSLSLLSPDGKTDRLLSKRRWNLFTWSKDGSSVYGLRAEKRHWMLVSIAVADGKEKTLSEFDLPLGQGLFGSLSLAPDGASVTTSLFHNKSDIWLIEDFNLTRR